MTSKDKLTTSQVPIDYMTFDVNLENVKKAQFRAFNVLGRIQVYFTKYPFVYKREGILWETPNKLIIQGNFITQEGWKASTFQDEIPIPETDHRLKRSMHRFMLSYIGIEEFDEIPIYDKEKG